MRIFGLELKKIMASHAIRGFIALCVALNALVIFDEGTDGYADFVAKTSKETGHVLGAGFNAVLERLPLEERNAEYAKMLREETMGAADVFDGYQTGGIADAYISAIGYTGLAAKHIQAKYAALQGSADEKAAGGESLTLYFAGSTYTRHSFLFGSVMGYLLFEGIFIAVAIALLSFGYEHMNGTEQQVCATKTGRGVMRRKLAAACAAGMLAYALLAAITLALYLFLDDHGDIWDSSVSSGFNYYYDVVAGARPFITWQSFTVFTYLMASLGLSAGIVLCFSLLGSAMGLLCRNGFIGFMSVAAFNALCVALPLSLLPRQSFAKFPFILAPIWLSLKHATWFTDGGFDVMWKNFETLGLCISLTLLAAACVVSLFFFRKRDIL